MCSGLYIVAKEFGGLEGIELHGVIGVFDFDGVLGKKKLHTSQQQTKKDIFLHKIFLSR